MVNVENGGGGRKGKNGRKVFPMDDQVSYQEYSSELPGLLLEVTACFPSDPALIPQSLGLSFHPHRMGTVTYSPLAVAVKIEC
jgi:hypothetical protein